MPQDYTQTVRSFYEAFARRDRELFAALLDPQIEWTAAAGELPLARIRVPTWVSTPSSI